MLVFGKGLDGQRGAVQPSRLLKEVATIAQETFSKAIRVKMDIPKDLWMASVNATQLHQVLMNLCVNARDAIEGEGEISLSGANIQLDQCYLQKQPQMKPGPYVLLKIRDSGAGIPLELQSKIFDPFFTTKPEGKGTGLGLPTVANIIKSHHGFLEFESKLNEGTEFRVYLPALISSFSAEIAPLSGHHRLRRRGSRCPGSPKLGKGPFGDFGCDDAVDGWSSRGSGHP